MSSRCFYAEVTIARCFAVAMKPRGGRKPDLIRQLQPARCGSKRVRSQPCIKTKIIHRSSVLPKRLILPTYTTRAQARSPTRDLSCSASNLAFSNDPLIGSTSKSPDLCSGSTPTWRSSWRAHSSCFIAPRPTPITVCRRPTRRQSPMWLATRPASKWRARRCRSWAPWAFPARRWSNDRRRHSGDSEKPHRRAGVRPPLQPAQTLADGGGVTDRHLRPYWSVRRTMSRRLPTCFDRWRAGIGKAMDAADRNVDRFIFVDRSKHLIDAARHSRSHYRIGNAHHSCGCEWKLLSARCLLCRRI
jgi:hypothetical protein